jgi:hypothetical protein
LALLLPSSIKAEPESQTAKASANYFPNLLSNREFLFDVMIGNPHDQAYLPKGAEDDGFRTQGNHATVVGLERR